MSIEDLDSHLAGVIRQRRQSLAANPNARSRTRVPEKGLLSQYTPGRLVAETARCEVGVSDELARTRRDRLAAEWERRDMHESAEAARQDAERAREEAERELARARELRAENERRRGPGVEPMVAAMLLAAEFGAADAVLAHEVDSAVETSGDLTPLDAQDVRGAHLTGLTPGGMVDELRGTEAAAVTDPAGNVTTGELLGSALTSGGSAGSDPDTDVGPTTSPAPDVSTT